MKIDYEASKRYWDANACGKDPIVAGNTMGSDPSFALYRHRCEVRRLKRFADFSGKTMLDLGCGSARFGIALSPLLSAYVGVDISAEQINLAKKALCHCPHVRLLQEM